MVKNKSCSTVYSRQSLDNGSGKIHVPSNYGAGGTDNDSCGDVWAPHDCPTGYKLAQNTNVFYDHGKKRSNGTRVSDNTLKTYKCWRGGNTHGRGAHAVRGMSHGIHGTFYHDSNRGSGRNNFAKPCFKDNGGWDLTDPTDGTKVRHPQAEYNADACCGFVDSVRRDVKEHYCKTNTCFKMDNDKTKDLLSVVCEQRLVDKCKNWSFVPDTLGFEDDRCATPLVQIAKQKQRSVSQLSAAQSDEAEQSRQTASIDDNNYRDYGDRLCTKQVFLDESDSGQGFIKKQKCIQWCRNNPNQCRDRIKNVCATIYEKSKALPDIYPDAIRENDNICACQWPEGSIQILWNFLRKSIT